MQGLRFSWFISRTESPEPILLLRPSFDAIFLVYASTSQLFGTAAISSNIQNVSKDLSVDDCMMSVNSGKTTSRWHY
jgi:hypothetical protein